MDPVKKYEGSILQTTPVWKNEYNEIAEKPRSYKDNTTLDMDDFYALMAAEMQYQDVLNPESNTSEMMSQMVQMSMINAIQDMMTMSMTSYAGSMMGKEVTIADSSTGKIETITGVVEGVNLYNGTPTIIVNGKEYSLTQIMGIGKQAETVKPNPDPDPDPDPDPVPGPDPDPDPDPVPGPDPDPDPVPGPEPNPNPPVTDGDNLTDQVTDPTNKNNPNKTGETDDTNTPQTEDGIKTETVENEDGEQA